MSRKIKLFLCDDHSVFREGLQAILRSDPSVEVVGEAGNGSEAIKKIQQVHPDIVLMDISMPERNGFEATRKIVQLSGKPKVLILTLHDEEDLIVRSLQAGASGYVLKDAPFDQLLYAVKEAFKGGKYLSPGNPTRVVAEYLRQSVPPKDTHDRSGNLEREILNLLAEGSSVKAIAFRLRLNVAAVEAALRKKIARGSSGKPGSTQIDRSAA